MNRGIEEALVGMAEAEGFVTALDVSQEYQIALEGLCDFASPEERVALSPCLRSILAAINRLLAMRKEENDRIHKAANEAVKKILGGQS